MVQYYTLEEAARILRTTPDRLREMAKNNEVRAFQDRGSVRFRSQEINELARSLGYGSDPEMPLGEAAKTPGSSGRRRSRLVEDVTEDVPLGQEKPTDKPSGRSGARSGPKSPPPKTASDSDVRLVLEGDNIDPSEPKTTPKSGPKKAGDSGPKMVPARNDLTDSDVKIVPGEDEDAVPASGKPRSKSPSDSDIRLDEVPANRPRRGKDEAVVTEEIDLDAEALRAAEAAAKAPKTKARTKHSPPGALPTSSPFELSDPDVSLDKGKGPKKPAAARADDSSSDFELIPLDGGKSPLDPGSDVPLLADDEVSLGDLSGGAGSSGINLRPGDSGISLEKGDSDSGSDEVEFELSLDAAATPKPGLSQPQKDSSSEFELTLDDGVGSSDEEGSDSEFELSLDAEGGVEGDPSSSEFELTLDAEGGLAVDEGGDKDIFEETDFSVPALDSESGSEAVALEESDTDVESSEEFELSLDGDEGDSGSQVVSLDDEEADAGAETVARATPRRKAVARPDSDEDFADREDEEDEEPVAAAAAPAPAAEWGPLPAVLLMPAVLVLFVVGLMSFELIQGMWGYNRGAKVSKPVVDSIARMFDDKLPQD